MWEANRSSPNLKIKKEGHQLSQTASSGIDTAFGIPPAVIIDHSKTESVCINGNSKRTGLCAFYEVKLEKIRGMVIVGWADRNTYLSTYKSNGNGNGNRNFKQNPANELELGCSPFTWGIDSLGRIGTNNVWKDYGRKMKEGDWLGCSLDVRTGVCRFYINGLSYGDAFTLPTKNTDQKKGAIYYYPAVTLRFRNTKILANFGNLGTPFRSLRLQQERLMSNVIAPTAVDVDNDDATDRNNVVVVASNKDEEFLPLFFIAKEIRNAMKKIATKTEERNQRESLLYQKLPNETLELIFSFLDVEELLNVSMTSRLFRKVASNQKHWLNLYYSTWRLSFPLLPNEAGDKTTDMDYEDETIEIEGGGDEEDIDKSSQTKEADDIGFKLTYKAKDGVICESLLGDKDPNEEVSLLPRDACHLEYNFENGICSSKVLLYSEESVPDIKVDRENIFFADGNNVAVMCRKTNTVVGHFIGLQCNVECLHLVRSPYQLVGNTVLEDRAKYCVSGSLNKQILAFNVQNGLVVQRLQHTGSVLSIHTPVDARDLAAVTRTGSIRIWDFETGQKKWEGSHPKPEGQTNSTLLKPSVMLTPALDHLVLSNNTRHIGIFDYRIKGDGALVNNINPDSDDITSFDFNPSTNTLLCSSLSTACPLQSISTVPQGGEVIKRMKSIGEGVLKCKYEGEEGRGRNIVCSTANALLVLDSRSGAIKSKISMPSIASWDRDLRYLYVAQTTGKITEFDFMKTKEVDVEWKTKTINDYFRFSRQNVHLTSQI
eukprot:TRINITY_DN855_c0_g3_i2.p1 TRINITY_DN855_c0_g3~~TRINITY_DN855_c0_g3_i2.p1  ORF type:complete len:771 (+),score=181.67 TRINITY_DN855_c0_g3_i2:415-2727(+)